MDFDSNNVEKWKEELDAYQSRLQSLRKQNLLHLDHFYRTELPSLFKERNPSPYITVSELSKLVQWKLTRGKWRPRLLDMVSSSKDEVVKSASQKAFASIPDLKKAVSELTILKGVGPATASAVLAAYSPEIAPFMSDEAMEATLGTSKDYSLKQYLILADKLQLKAKELTTDGDSFTPSDVERALWSAAVAMKLQASTTSTGSKAATGRASGRKRKRN